MKAIIKIVSVKETSGVGKNGTWNRKSVEVEDAKGGKYFSAFKMQYQGSKADQVIMEGWENLTVGTKGLAEYEEDPNVKNPEYPYKNIKAFHLSDENSEFPLIKNDAAGDYVDANPRENTSVTDGLDNYTGTPANVEDRAESGEPPTTTTSLKGATETPEYVTKEVFDKAIEELWNAIIPNEQ